MVAKNAADVSRFAKLFHPLGLAGEGVQKYVGFIRRSLAERCAVEFRLLAPSFKRADTGPTPYESALTSVFVAIADIVQEHQGSVEQEFGTENFIVVVRGLLEEADMQGMRVIEKFAKDHAKVFGQQAVGDTREVGAALEEAALLTQRTQQFHSYIHNMARSVVDLIPDREAFIASLPQGYSDEDGLPPMSKLLHRVQELVSSYVVAEMNFLLHSVEKAVSETDRLDLDDPEQLTTTLVDDAFFVLQQAMNRAITTFDINAVCAVVNNVSGAITNEIRSALVKSLADSEWVYKYWVANLANLDPPAHGEHPLTSLFLDVEGDVRDPLTSADSWPHSLNNIQQCAEYVDKLRETTTDAFLENFPDQGMEKDKFDYTIASLEQTKAELEALHNGECRKGLLLFWIHLQPMLDTLSSLDYDIDEAQYADCQVNDPFARPFIEQAEVIHQHLRRVLNPASCEEILQEMVEQICTYVAEIVLEKRFSLFGANQLDNDVRGLCSFFTQLGERPLRHKFARLFEMADVLNTESIEEFGELFGEATDWRLEPGEIGRLLTSRVEFNVTAADLRTILPQYAQDTP